MNNTGVYCIGDPALLQCVYLCIMCHSTGNRYKIVHSPPNIVENFK